MKSPMSIIENCNAAIINSRNQDIIVFESGHAYQIYCKKKDNPGKGK